LVLQRHRHLKWQSFDRLELILMYSSAACCASLSLSVTCDIVTRTIRPSLAVAAGSHFPPVHLCIFIGAAVATAVTIICT